MITKIIMAVMAAIIWLFSLVIVRQSSTIRYLQDGLDTIAEQLMKEQEDDNAETH